LCDRRFGIGADGIMLLENIDQYDFKMLYYNADGNESTMCGNGGRCLVRFAEDLQMIQKECHFLAVDGPHYAKISEKEIELGMIDVQSWDQDGEDLTLNTGSPHYITWVDDLESLDVFKEGRNIRYNARYQQEGINVNFLSWKNNALHVRTYERGVEDETLSCGTGVTAAAMAYAIKNNIQGEISVPIQTKGGNLEVRFHRNERKFTQVFLIGPAVKVFEGSIEIS
jgi:diaminopimelate epimerase